jgi:hypothetical protein
MSFQLKLKSKTSHRDIQLPVLSVTPDIKGVLITFPKDEQDASCQAKLTYDTLINNGYNPEEYGSYKYCLRLTLTHGDWMDNFVSVHTDTY